MQSNHVERLSRPTTRARNPEELEALRQRKGKRNKTSRGERHEWVG
ncbi:hypothetical protein [Pseudomonas sp. SID14000]|nr:hypothetical protein [Pseudomonas sp. SID14000]